MNKSHTPGPWHVDMTCGGLAIESARNGNIGIVNLARASKQDAALIAASPDLLELHRRMIREREKLVREFRRWLEKKTAA